MWHYVCPFTTQRTIEQALRTIEFNFEYYATNGERKKHTDRERGEMSEEIKPAATEKRH